MKPTFEEGVCVRSDVVSHNTHSANEPSVLALD
jgi:hypothetical protein